MEMEELQMQLLRMRIQDDHMGAFMEQHGALAHYLTYDSDPEEWTPQQRILAQVFLKVMRARFNLIDSGIVKSKREREELEAKNGS